MNGMKWIMMVIACVALCGMARGAASQPGGGQGIVVKGELVADFRAEFEPNAVEWANHSTSAKSVGPMARFDRKPLHVETIAGPGGAGVMAVRLARGAIGGYMKSAKMVPAEIAGEGSSSVEAWIIAAAPLAGDATVVSYGARERGRQRQYLYGTRKPLSGFFADVGDWGTFEPDAMKWHHLAWVYDQATRVMTVYVDGEPVTRARVNLSTAASPLVLGVGPSEGGAGDFDYDPISAYVAAVRVHTGVLTGAEVRQNFGAGLPGAGARAVVAPFGGEVAAAPVLGRFVDPAPAEAPESTMALWYRQPARNWIDAMPLGNGRLGAMVFGGVERERIGLNEDTLWSGGPYDPAVEVAPGKLQEIRRLMFEGKAREAQNLANDLQGRPRAQASYQTVGELRLTFLPQEAPSGYRRELDIDTAVSRVTYKTGGVRHTREYFVSPVDQVVVIRLTADGPGRIGFEATLGTPQQEFTVQAAGNEVIMNGRNGDMRTTPVIPGALKFQARVRVLTEGGETSAAGGTVSVKGANAATIYVAAATSYKKYNDVSGDPDALCRGVLERAAGKSYDSMKREHVAAHQSLFRRVALDLGKTAAMTKPTDQRLREVDSQADPQLAALYFQFGRYLLIASSRPGSQPANLQGIWNQDLMAAWGGKYTVNINTEMNYWPSLAPNLPELQEPLLMMVQDCAVTGAVTAQRIYKARGWVLHHNTDLWRATAPIDGAYWGMWPTGGAWLCNTLFDEYRFSGDPAYLRTMYPLIKGSAQFFLDTLVEEPKHKWLVTNPSNSPEHEFERGVTNCAGPTMDMSILRELFTNVIDASKTLGVDEEFRRQVEAARARLAPYQVGKAGQLQEWLEDLDTEAPEIAHRHMSPLYGLYPGNDITPADPKVFAAARKLMEMRAGNTPTMMGWGVAWRIALWARLGDGEQAYACLRNQLANRTEMNMFDKPSVQLDGNYGATAAVAEMLLQSHTGEVHLLPALPKAWPAGKVTGLRARGGAVVDVEWAEGKLKEAVVRSPKGGRFVVRVGERRLEVAVAAGGEVKVGGG